MLWIPAHGKTGWLSEKETPWLNIVPIFKGVFPSLLLPLCGLEVGLVQDSHTSCSSWGLWQICQGWKLSAVEREQFAFPLAAPCSWNNIFCCECTSRLVDVLCLGWASPWSFLLSKWATEFEDKQRIQFLGTKVTCQQYACYRLYIWIIPYHAMNKQWNRHRQQHPQLLYHVCIQKPARSNYQDWKTAVVTENLQKDTHSAGAVERFLVS